MPYDTTNLIQSSLIKVTSDFIFQYILERVTLCGDAFFQKAKMQGKRPIPSDVLSVLDVNLCNFLWRENGDQQVERENEVDLESDQPNRNVNPIAADLTSLFSSKSSENSGNTAETASTLNSRMSSQMSKKLEESKQTLVPNSSSYEHRKS